MAPYSLRDNKELSEYLTQLSQKLQDNNQVQLAEQLRRATLFAMGSPSEFLHEAQMALKRVVVVRPKHIDFNEVESVIAQIQEAFRNIGGA